VTDPQDIASEEALIGSILVSPGVAKKVEVDPEAFYRPRHGLIWAAATTCAANGGCDPVTVAAELERRGQLEEVGGRDRLLSLAATTPAPRNAGAYAKRVKEKAELRAIRRSAQAVLEAVTNEDEPAIARALEDLGHPIRYVDVASGELVESCPTCEERDAVIQKLEYQHRSDLSRISRLEGSAEKKARKHKLWGEIEAAHEWWRLATGHFGVTFTPEDFAQALPRWKELGRGRANPIAGFLKGVAGIASDPSTKRMKNGRIQAFDSWELLTRSQPKFLEFCDRAPGREDTDDWKLALVQMIKANFKP
jgi:hypothetical protein